MKKLQYKVVVAKGKISCFCAAEKFGTSNGLVSKWSCIYRVGKLHDLK